MLGQLAHLLGLRPKSISLMAFGTTAYASGTVTNGDRAGAPF